MRRHLLIPAVVAATLVTIMVVVIGVLLTRRHGTTDGPQAQSSASVPVSATATSPGGGASGSPGGPTARPSATPSRSPSTSPTTAQPSVPRSLLGKDVEVIPTGRRVVALTFDIDGNADGLPAILRALAAEKVHATFFVTGRFAARNPSAVRAMVAAGHRVGNHSNTHPYFTELSDSAIRTELTTAYRQIAAVGNSDPRPLFRFPYGDRNARTIAAVNATGYVAVRWTVDTLGWKGTSAGITVQQVVDRAVGAARPGEIVLMHVSSHPTDHSTLDADALPAVIDRLQAAGYGFTTLDALLG